MRALFVVNPHATSTTAETRDGIAAALRRDLDLRVAHTEYRRHAVEIAREAARDGTELIITLGGDGTINEVVNGLLTPDRPGDAPGDPAPESRPPAEELPLLAALPGGSANVFIRSLGQPADPEEAAEALLAAVAKESWRTIGLGLADDRYFTFCAGLGLDAEVVHAVDEQRTEGHKATATRYMLTALRHFLLEVDRSDPAIELLVPGEPDPGRLFYAVVTNTSPWTYAGDKPVRPTPLAGLDTGLDLFALTQLEPLSVLGILTQMLAPDGLPPVGDGYITRHDMADFRIRASRPTALQIDGEYIGERSEVHFRSAPESIRIVL
ncbi:diacylglycerol/lipid kinase family protein [Allonocardiopsis opalescens]|uniref:Diacylglycerol kinase family enzyme n=1 Tax=Allonocardiopsis opalescens TaxID=1144618 RepID=A0A2T0QDM7_9ACTN|nr:diacylglycerol kinase family protein [Allonocardiopsis opalescens]PRY02056.1 diacylglycerol kinase family enzyme [Allonocardiopsis opalescens]